MQEPTPDPTAIQGFDQSPQVGTVELDRYCAGCGYNLRQQAVRREPTTKLLLCKCPECGAFEPANQATTRRRSWFAQFVFLFWLAWIAALGGILAMSISALVSLSIETGDLLNETKYLDKAITEQTSSGEREINFQYQLRALDGDRAFQLSAFLFASLIVGMGLIAVACIFLPHWKRRGYTLLALGWPIIALIAFYGMVANDYYVLKYATAGLKTWIFLSPLLVGLLAMAGGLIAIRLARPIARLIIRIVIPSRQRGPFAYLWLIDDKAIPGTVAAPLNKAASEETALPDDS